MHIYMECVDSCYPSITNGEEYLIIDDFGETFVTIDDNGVFKTVLKSRFEMSKIFKNN